VKDGGQNASNDQEQEDYDEKYKINKEKFAFFQNDTAASDERDKEDDAATGKHDEHGSCVQIITNDERHEVLINTHPYCNAEQEAGHTEDQEVEDEKNEFQYRQPFFVFLRLLRHVRDMLHSCCVCLSLYSATPDCLRNIRRDYEVSKYFHRYIIYLLQFTYL